MIGNIAFVGENLKKGLEKQGLTVLLDDDLHWTDIFRKKYGKQSFDIVHIHSPNFKKLCIAWRYITYLSLFFDAKLVCHWHGSDLRHPLKAFPVYRFLQWIGDYHLYSNIDLRWWLRNILDKKKKWFICPVDTDMFYPKKEYEKRKEKLIWGKKYVNNDNCIPHDEVSDLLNQYKIIECHQSDGLSDYLLSVSQLESAACGCKVPPHDFMNRQWIINNASIESQTKNLLDIYKKVLMR